MQRRRYLAGIGVAATTGFGGCLGGGGGTDQQGIAIGSDIPYKPFEYRTASGELTGFDPAMAEAIFAEQLDREYYFKKTAWDGIISALNNGNIRVIMSAMTINETRAKKVDFSQPYFTAYQTILVLDGQGIALKDDLRGTAVGVQKGTTGEQAATELKSAFGGELTIQRYDQITGAFDALVNNQVSAVINDNTVNAQFAAENDAATLLEGEGVAAEQGENAPPYLTLTVENYGIAFRQEDDDLRESVDEALAAIKESGRYDEIYGTYFSG